MDESDIFEQKHTYIRDSLFDLCESHAGTDDSVDSEEEERFLDRA